MKRPLDHAERGRLGGMRAAERMTPAERSWRAEKGAAGLASKLADVGIDPQHHYFRLAMRRHRGVAAEIEPGPGASAEVAVVVGGSRGPANKQKGAA